MNSSLYVFGMLDDGYTQYPSDYASAVLKQGASLTEAPSTMVVHRDGALMYYSYIRRLEAEGKGQYIGFCTVMNGVFLPQVHAMMSMYEHMTTQLVRSGHLLRLTDGGRLVASVGSLRGQEQTVERVQKYISRSMAQWEHSWQKLPPASYGVSDTHVTHFGPDSTEEQIAAAACQGGYAVVTKTDDYDDDQLTGYRAVVAQLTSERDALQQKNNELVSSVRRTLRREHRMRRWVLSILALLAVGYGFSKLLKHLETTQENLDTAVSTISGQRDRISGLNSTVDQLREEAQAERKAREKAQQELAHWKAEVGLAMPLLVTDVEVANVTAANQIISDYGEPIYAGRAQYLKPRLTYMGISVGEEVFVKVRLYTPSGRVMQGYTSPESFTYQQSIVVDEGENEVPLMGWGADHGHYTSGEYRFEFWHGHVCLKAHTFHIY